MNNRQQVNETVASLEHLKDFELDQDVKIFLREFDDGTYDIDIIRFFEIVESFTNLNYGDARDKFFELQMKYIQRIICNKI